MRVKRREEKENKCIKYRPFYRKQSLSSCGKHNTVQSMVVAQLFKLYNAHIIQECITAEYIHTWSHK